MLLKVPTCCSCHIMGYSYVYPPIGKKELRQTPAQSRSVSSLPSPPQKQIQQQNRRSDVIPKFRSEKASRKPIFPDLKPITEFQNFMSPMKHKFPFQIAKKRDGLVGKPIKSILRKASG